MSAGATAFASRAASSALGAWVSTSMIGGPDPGPWSLSRLSRLLIDRDLVRVLLDDDLAVALRTRGELLVPLKLNPLGFEDADLGDGETGRPRHVFGDLRASHHLSQGVRACGERAVRLARVLGVSERRIPEHELGAGRGVRERLELERRRKDPDRCKPRCHGHRGDDQPKEGPAPMPAERGEQSVVGVAANPRRARP